MGVVEAMVHSESLGPIKSANSICYEERSGRFVMENCNVALSKYKRRKVSAVRDFPLSCGRVSSQIDLRPVDGVTCAGNTEDLLCGLPGVPTNSDVHVASKFAPGCSPVSPKINLRPATDAACAGTTRNSDVHVASDLLSACVPVSPGIYLRPSEDAAGVCNTEDLLGGLHEVPRNSDVNVAIDSPGCRSVSPQISLRAAENRIADNSLGGSAEVTRTSDVHVATKVVESVAERQAMFTYQGDGQNPKDVEPSNTQSEEDLEGLKDLGLTTDHGKSVEHDTSSLSKDFHETCDTIPSKEISRSSLKNLPVDCSVSVGNGGGLENVVDRNFPHRRRVSAVRDFPSFCGRDTPLLSKEGYVNLRASVNEKSLGQENSGFDDKPSSEVVSKYDKKKRENTQQGKASNECLENTSKLNMDKVRADSKVIYFKESGATEEIGIGNEASREKGDRPYLSKSNHFKYKSDRNVNINEKMGKEYTGDISSKKKLSDQYGYPSGQKKESFVSSEILSDRIVVQALMASSSCPWRQGKSLKRLESGTSKMGQVKKHVAKQVGNIKFFARTKDEGKDFDGKFLGKESKMSSKATHRSTVQLVIREEDMFEHDNVRAKKSKMTASGTHGGRDQHLIQGEDMSKLKNDDFNVSRSSRAYGVSVTPFGQRSLNGNSLDSDAIVPRTKVRETLRLFHTMCRKLLQEEEARSKKAGKNSHKRVDLQAAKILKDKGKYVNEGKQILGSVPGVDVGDEFRYRVELNVIGLHRQIQGGIDYVKHGGKILATSIVASGGYSDDLDCSDALVYTGQGGNVMNSDKEPEDQKLERGNLALKNSLDERNLVRVIRGSDISDGRTYVYDGLYLVDKWWQDVGPHGKLVFKFLLNRIPNQPELAWKEVKKSKKFKVREGICVDDISQGKERCPISAVNTVDDEKPPPFTYITRIIYPDWCQPVPPKGCDCTNGCSYSCSCAVKNGGELPYNYNEAIVEAKPLVYECGPSCKCPSSCSNRVSQKGIKFQLEIFKTKSRGWGVRSLNSIPSGSFICEYAGELIDEKEAEQRSNDEYLFDIGNNYNDSALWDGLSTLMPEIQASSSKEVEEGNFTIDAAQFGNVGRFINHCCSPNLYAQNVLYDFEDKRVPHIMLFAAENIPPLQELTYHYNYVIDQVRDSDGNIKKKSCYCGSVECTEVSCSKCRFWLGSQRCNRCDCNRLDPVLRWKTTSLMVTMVFNSFTAERSNKVCFELFLKNFL